MDIKELRGKSPEELRKLSHQLQTQLQDLRVKLATRQSKQTSKLKEMTREIARIETLLNDSVRLSV